jgi:carbon-monoxide dehydrogenase small subunit
VSLRVQVTLDGAAQVLDGATNTLLVDAMRERGTDRTRVSCDQGVCGACTVLVDGLPTASCMTPLFAVDGKRIETIAGLRGTDGALHPIQQAFVEESAFQCGFCTPGMIMLVKGMFDEEGDPDEATVLRWLSSNICRCTGYAPILRAVERARTLLRT